MPETKVYRDRNFQIICGTGLTGMMMVSLIVPAFPQMVEALNVPAQSIGLINTMITLPQFFFAPLCGVLADRLGRKRVIVTYLFLYGLFGGCCAFATSFNTLLILRVLQGVSASPLLGVTGAMIGDMYTGPKRAEAMSINTTGLYVGYIVFPLVGGALANLGWNYAFLPFLGTIPLGIIALLYLRCPEPQNTQSMKDYMRGALSHLKSLKVLWVFSVAVLTYVIFHGAYLIYFSLLLGDRFQASPFTIGLVMSALGVITAIASYQVGWLSKRFSPVSLIMCSFVIYAVTITIIPSVPYLWLCLVPTIIFGIAQGLNLPSNGILAASVAPLEHRAGFMSINGTMVMLGMTVGPPLMGMVYSLTNLSAVFYIAAVIALIIPGMALIIGRGKLSATE